MGGPTPQCFTYQIDALSGLWKVTAERHFRLFDMRHPNIIAASVIFFMSVGGHAAAQTTIPKYTSGNGDLWSSPDADTATQACANWGIEASNFWRGSDGTGTFFADARVDAWPTPNVRYQVGPTIYCLFTKTRIWKTVEYRNDGSWYWDYHQETTINDRRGVGNVKCEVPRG